jgi:hypothetical protein
MRWLLALVIIGLLPRTATAQFKCCFRVTAINAKTGVVAAAEASTGVAIQFQLADRLMLAKVKVDQQVHADVAARRVSLDGRQACCAIVGTPVTPPRVTAAVPPAATVTAPIATRPAPPSLADTRAAGPVTTPLHTTITMPTIAYGTPYKPTGTRVPSAARVQSRTLTTVVNGRNQTGAILQLRGREGIEKATGLSAGARTLLAMHVRTLAVGEPATYIVNTQLAEEWVKAHPVPPEMKPVEPSSGGGGGDDCKGMISMNCAQQNVEQVGEVLEEAWEMTVEEFDRFRERAVEAWDKGADQLTDAWNMAQGCFTERTLSLADIPVKFAITPSMTIDLAQGGGRGPATGKLTGSVGLGVPMQGDFVAKLDLFYIPCLPFAVRPRALSADGMMTVGQVLQGNVSATGAFKKQFTIPPTGGPVIPIQVFPIIIAGVPVSEVDISAYVEGNIEVSADGQAEGRFQLQNTNPTRFDFSCNGGGCKAHSKGLPAPVTASQGAQIEGRVSVKPAIYTALQLNFNYQALSARAGPQPFLLGVASGCGAVAATQTSGGASTTQTNHALTGDLDWGVELRAEALVLRKIVGTPYVTRLMQDKHIWFRDLAPGGSTAFVPTVASPSQAAAAQPTTHKVKMPTCYPYPDRVQYQISWTGNATPAPVSGCSWKTGGGTCSFDPTKDLVIGLTWPAAGNQSLSVQAIGDRHGRAFSPAPPATQVMVSVGGTP